MGTLNDNSFTLVRNNIPQMAFLSSHIVAYKSFYLVRGDEGGYIGMQSLTDNKEFGIFLGNNINIITWKMVLINLYDLPQAQIFSSQ